MVVSKFGFWYLTCQFLLSFIFLSSSLPSSCRSRQLVSSFVSRSALRRISSSFVLNVCFRGSKPPIDIKNLHYSLAQKYYDKHTLYTDAGAIPKDKIERIFGDAVNRCVQNLKLQGIKIDPTHKVNLMTNKDNQSLGYAYIWSMMRNYTIFVMD